MARPAASTTQRARVCAPAPVNQAVSVPSDRRVDSSGSCCNGTTIGCGGSRPAHEPRSRRSKAAGDSEVHGFRVQ